MKLNIGVINQTHGWTLLLEQEGVPFSSAKEDLLADDYSVLIWTDSKSNDDIESIRTYLRAGGALLCSTAAFRKLSDIQSKKIFVKYIVPHSGSEFSDVGLLDIQHQSELPDDANEMLTDAGHRCVSVREFEGGHIIVLPFDPAGLVLDDRTSTKSFYANRSRLPFEHVSLAAKRAVRQLVARSLEILHHKRGLPYVHRWYFPQNSQTVFAFRIDTDKADREEIQSLNTFFTNEHRMAATWFVDVQSQQHWLAEYAAMAGHEIGLHCYSHQPYVGFEDSTNDIKRGYDFMVQAGITPAGFAAPYGRWNKAIGRAIESNTFDYSSEFSFDYDNFPSYPMIDGTVSHVLQVPVHPVSIGSLRRQGFTETQMTEYFLRVMEEKCTMREPLFFYHHPKDHHEAVLTEMFRWVKEHNIQPILMRDYAAWWKKRNLIRDNIHVNNSELTFESEHNADEVWIHITKSDGSEIFVPAQQKIDIGSLEWKQRPAAMPLPSDIRRIRSLNPWIALIRLEDKLFNFLHRS